jgi:hypothetical protein
MERACNSFFHRLLPKEAEKRKKMKPPYGSGGRRNPTQMASSG